MAVNSSKSSDLPEAMIKLDTKYKIKRPSYDEMDFRKLQDLVHMEQKRHPRWPDFWLEDGVLIRFLRAFITVEVTLEALKSYCQWRLKFNVDEISPDDPDIKKETAIARDIHIENFSDISGRPIAVVYPSLHDSYHGNYDSLNKYIMFQIEQLCAGCDIISPDGRFTLIFDLKGFSMRNMDYQCVKKIVWFLKNCYPERLGVCLIINYTWIFYGCWEVIKLWLNDVTRSKIIFCGEKELRDFIDIDACPIKLM